jgi:hypothetical protein
MLRHDNDKNWRLQLDRMVHYKDIDDVHCYCRCTFSSKQKGFIQLLHTFTLFPKITSVSACDDCCFLCTSLEVGAAIKKTLSARVNNKYQVRRQQI